MSAELTELRITSFKSVKDARLELGPLTLIVGRNGSGKSNVLDALAVLSALASGLSLRDALDGGRDGPIVRGGSAGCAPIGSNSFAIGCTATEAGVRYHLDVEVQVAPTLQIVAERLWTVRVSGSRRGEPKDFLKSDPPTEHSADISARWDNGKRGVNPAISMRADQLLTTQIATRVPTTSAAGRDVHDAASKMIEAIAGIFLLDPVPHQMREYVPEKDSRLRRNADNLSATVGRLVSDGRTRETILDMTRSLSEAQVSSLRLASSELGDVMLQLDEQVGEEVRPVPARLMSDGTLRFLAIAAAMLDSADEQGGVRDSRTLVVEELENGLHPSQAHLLLSRLKSVGAERRVRTVATTHSPAILDALDGRDHESVFVATREADGWSHVRRLTEFPDYFDVVASQTLGEAATKDELRPTASSNGDVRSMLSAIFG